MSAAQRGESYLSFLLVAGMTCLGEVSAAEPMEFRTYLIAPEAVSRMSLPSEDEGWMRKEGFDDSIECVFGLLGVDWPEGSSIAYVKTVGALNVRNTPENLAKVEKVLAEFAMEPVNIEIDTRFVEAGRAALEAVGYFDTNRVDAAVLQERLLARADVRLLESLRVVTSPSNEAVAKHVVEYIYPTDYDVQLPVLTADATPLPEVATNSGLSCHCVSAAVEPQSFTMHEVGAIVCATPDLTDDGGLIDLRFSALLVDEPEWKDYGAKANWKGAEACYDLSMEQPFFPVRLAVDAPAVYVRSGSTLVFGGVTDSRKANEDKFVFVFVTARLVGGDGAKREPVLRRMGEPEVRRQSSPEGMEAWTFYYSAPKFCCGMEAIPDPDEKPKTPWEVAAEKRAAVAEGEQIWKEWFTNVAGVDWPEGSAVHKLTHLDRIWIKNTPENLAKIAKSLSDMFGGVNLVELDVRCISADRKALSEVGYFDTNRVDAAVLLERLMARSDARLLEAPRLVTRSGNEAVVKGVLEYNYPTDYDVLAGSALTAGTNAVSGVGSTGVAVEPQSFMMRAVGTSMDATPYLTDDGNVVDIGFRADLVGEPEWRDYGAKAKWKGPKIYDLPMEQPFFPVVAAVDANVSMRPGATYVFGGGADRRKGEEGRFVLVFVTPRLVAP